MNVLMTSAGRRDYLVDYFRDATGVGTVIAADASPLASALSVADVGLLVPPFHHPEYIPSLLEIVRDHHVGLVLSVSDHDALVLAGHLDAFTDAGCIPMIPTARVVRLVMDKRWLGAYCRRIGVATPRTFYALEDALQAVIARSVDFPLVVKPRLGSASIGTYVVHGVDELTCAVTMSGEQAARVAIPGAGDRQKQVLIQEHVPGPEFGIDVINDARSRHLTTFVREKLAMRGGETDKARTTHDPVLSALGRRLGEALQHVGCLDCDVVMHGGVPYLLDANPRIGGGYPFVHEAGADLPTAYLAWAAGDPAPSGSLEYADGVVGSKSSRVQVNRVELEVQR